MTSLFGTLRNSLTQIAIQRCEDAMKSLKDAMKSPKTDDDKYAATELKKAIETLAKYEEIIDAQEIPDIDKKALKKNSELMLALICGLDASGEKLGISHLHPSRRHFSGIFAGAFPGALELLIASGKYTDEELIKHSNKALEFARREHGKGAKDTLATYPESMNDTSKLGSSLGGRVFPASKMRTQLEQFLVAHPRNQGRKHVLEKTLEGGQQHEAVVDHGLIPPIGITDKKTGKEIGAHTRTLGHVITLEILRQVPDEESAKALYNNLKNTSFSTTLLSGALNYIPTRLIKYLTAPISTITTREQQFCTLINNPSLLDPMKAQLQEEGAEQSLESPAFADFSEEVQQNLTENLRLTVMAYLELALEKKLDKATSEGLNYTLTRG